MKQPIGYGPVAPRRDIPDDVHDLITRGEELMERSARICRRADNLSDQLAQLCRASERLCSANASRARRAAPSDLAPRASLDLDLA